MEKLLERVTLGDLLGVIAPGAALLTFFAFLHAGDKSIDVPDFGGSWAAPFLFVLLAFLIGTLLSDIANVGTREFMARDALGRAVTPQGAAYTRLAMPGRRLLGVVFGLPLPPDDFAVVAAQAFLDEYIESRVGGAQRLVASRWDRLELVRNVLEGASETSRRKAERVATMHAHLMFALTSSLACIICALSTLFSSWADGWSPWCLVVTVVLISISFVLRQCAARKLELELALAVSAVRD